MPLLAYRVCKTAYRPFDGTGAFLYGARWNSPGGRVVYAADAYAGSLLELLVHANLGRLPGPHHCGVLSVPEDVAVETVPAEAVPGWDAADPVAARAYGDGWLAAQRTAVLIVPSVVARPFGRNVLFNPAHPDAGRIETSDPVPVAWDARLFYR